MIAPLTLRASLLTSAARGLGLSIALTRWHLVLCRKVTWLPYRRARTVPLRLARTSAAVACAVAKAGYRWIQMAARLPALRIRTAAHLVLRAQRATLLRGLGTKAETAIRLAVRARPWSTCATMAARAVASAHYRTLLASRDGTTRPMVSAASRQPCSHATTTTAVLATQYAAAPCRRHQ